MCTPGAGIAALAACVALVGFSTSRGILAYSERRARRKVLHVAATDAGQAFQNELVWTQSCPAAATRTHTHLGHPATPFG